MQAQVHVSICPDIVSSLYIWEEHRGLWRVDELGKAIERLGFTVRRGYTGIHGWNGDIEGYNSGKEGWLQMEYSDDPKELPDEFVANAWRECVKNRELF
jgi:hypothetical protein